MKSNLVEISSKEEYPCLKIDNEQSMVILFINEFKGTVVWISPTAKYYMGEIADCWEPDCFSQFTGTIELKN